MRVIKAINNNVVSAKDDTGREFVVMGRGIGFKVKENMEIDQDRIEKVFYMDNQNTIDHFKELLSNIPMQHFKVSNDIITYAKQILNKKLNQNIYITLTDHINFAVERYNQGMMFQNPLLWEVQSIYKNEFQIGEYAIRHISDQLGIFFPEDEAASIALHIVNAEYNTVMADAMNMTKMVPVIVDIVKEYYQTDIAEDSLHYERFVTHLKFLAQRIINRELLDSQEAELHNVVTNLYPKEYACAQEIAKYIENIYTYKITEEELVYLTVHIRRVITVD
ncbi:PRD domain-containing protein [Vallitaleaceae bacterium 9-2]